MSPAREESLEGLIIIARGVRARGLNGELLADVLTDFPQRFEDISQVLAVGPDGQRKQLTLDDYWFQNERLVLKFAGYDSPEAAHSLAGYEFGLPESERVQLAADEFYDWELEGCSVEIDKIGALGIVRQVMRTGGVELLVVEDEAGRQRLIPMVQSIVVEIDISNQRIVIDPPEGLLDL
jgi:16S rRNA processing protein RimM